jgi:hypothetical protein
MAIITSLATVATTAMNKFGSAAHLKELREYNDVIKRDFARLLSEAYIKGESSILDSPSALLHARAYIFHNTVSMTDAAFLWLL